MTRTASLADLAGAIDAGPLAGFRNAIINGNFDIWQRGTSFSNPASGAYTTDRWLLGYDGSSATRTLSRQTFTLGQTDVPGEPTYFFRYDQSVAGSGGTFSVLIQRVESVCTFAGQQVTLSFWAKAAASLTMPAISLRQSFGTGGSPSSYVDTHLVFNQAVTTSWVKYTYTATLPSISGKTLGSDNNNFFELLLFLPTNTTFTFDLAQVQLEAGPVATPFERRPIGTELALCQRYYEIVNIDSIFRTTTNGNYGGVIYQCWYKSTKRAIPSITFYSSPNRTGTSGVLSTPQGAGGTSSSFATSIKVDTLSIWNNAALPNEGDFAAGSVEIVAEL